MIGRWWADCSAPAPPPAIRAKTHKKIVRDELLAGKERSRECDRCFLLLKVGGEDAACDSVNKSDQLL